ncbi:hypothetical protein [Nocardia sp. NBC_00511]|uniref:hypothetical protein n=1 Tax=Nocardia sp. NBC_00511 TaxID=2903591 RepID=UPI0030DE5901
MDGSNAGADDRAVFPVRRLPKHVAGVVAAVGAVSAGLILIGACGLGHQDTYVAPPPINADLQVAPETSTPSHSGTSTTGVIIPPSPTWRVAADMPSRRAPISTITATPDDPLATTTTTRTTTSRPSTTRPTETTRTTTEAPVTTEVTTTPVTTDRPASDNTDG